MSKLDEFFAVVKRIGELTDNTTSYCLQRRARNLPKIYAGQASAMTLNENSYTSYRAPDNVRVAFTLAVKRVTKEERERGERERDHLLFQYSEELESLRAILPSLAARAAIEIGVIAREIKP